MAIQHFLVSGRVQGVGFRRFVQRLAQDLALKGATRNLENGAVEIIASGPATKLQTFADGLRKGPPFSSVSDLQIQTLEESALKPDHKQAAETFEFAILKNAGESWEFKNEDN